MQILISEIFAALAPFIVTGFGTVLTILLTRLTTTLRVRWGIEIEAKHRDALQMAVMSGIRAAVSRGLTGRAAIEAALKHAATSVPDAIEILKPAEGVLASIAEAKLREASAAALPAEVASLVEKQLNLSLSQGLDAIKASLPTEAASLIEKQLKVSFAQSIDALPAQVVAALDEYTKPSVPR